MKRFIFLILFCIFSQCFAYDLYSQPTQRILDYSNVLSESQNTSILSTLNLIYDTESQTEIEVLIIPALPQNKTLIDLNTELFNKWKLGNKDLNNGILVTIVTSTNNIRISTGRGMDGMLPDSYLGRLMDDNHIKEQLINKQYYSAISKTIESMNYSIKHNQFGAHDTSNIQFKFIIAVIIAVILFLIIGSFIKCGDSLLSLVFLEFILRTFLIIIQVMISVSSIGGGGSSNGGGSSR